MKPFDFVNAINFNKKNMIHDSESPEAAEASYTPFLVNKSLSYFPDTILFANEMNTRGHIDNKLQFEYLLNNIRPKKRFSKWHKKEQNDDLLLIQEYYHCNVRKAEQILKTLKSDELNEIKRRITTCEES